MVTLTHPVREARKIGSEHGKALASWAEIDESNAAEIIRLDNDGDPVFWDGYRNPLSGEYADDYSESQLLVDCGISSGDAAASDEHDLMPLRDTLSNAYSDAHADAWHDEIVARATYYL